MRINIYGRPNCQWCTAAQELLKMKGYVYEYINLFDMEPNDARAVVTASGMKTVPIVQIDDIYIGGFDALEAYINGLEERNV